jgi:hypothetical protein
MRIWGLKNGVDAVSLGRGRGNWAWPEQLLYTVGTVSEGAGLGEIRAENEVSRRQSRARADMVKTGRRGGDIPRDTSGDGGRNLYFPVHLFPCLLRHIRRNTRNDVRDPELRCTEFHFCPSQSNVRLKSPRSVGYTISIQPRRPQKFRRKQISVRPLGENKPVGVIACRST